MPATIEPGGLAPCASWPAGWPRDALPDYRVPEVNPIAIASMIFLGSLAAALLGVALQLPSRHFDDSSRDVVKSVLGLVATLTALVLGLLVASAQGTYQTLGSQLDQMAGNLVELDCALDVYGSEAAPARTLFHRALRAEINRIWSQGEARLESIRPDDIRRQRDQFMAMIGQFGSILG